MAEFGSVLDQVGGTPLIRLNRMAPASGAQVWLKAEFLNPGGSVKDRAALSMVLAAEESGVLQPGGTIIESTSGNTGIGLAIVAAQRGYRLIVVLPDKSSKEKIDTLKAYGAEVVITPGMRPLGHPEHIREVAARIAAETGAWWADQYNNPANPDAHRATTGPEIWAQTEGRITHFVCGIGTGGTITGTGEFLKQISDGRVQVIGADPEHSTYSGGDGSPYLVESIGHYRHPDTVDDVWPESYNAEVADRIERIGDRESILTARRLAREEGLLLGGSAGTAVAAALRVAQRPDDVVVVIIPDSGKAYLSKYYDDEWLARLGFLEGTETLSPSPVPWLPATATVGDALARTEPDDLWPVCAVRAAGPPSVAEVVGTLDIAALRDSDADPAALVTDHTTEPLPAVGIGESTETVLSRLDGRDAAWVLVDGRVHGVIHKHQL
ncbi:pyridoxal-phosphate dependent enzyme [Actinocrispum sp. NPDC049592]|uniref:PLP-dependent cysteine synthase family protein n=1 Tax=Actinocrispum sp. NPDC049592 TaxID=3154835 RepID=UPI003448B261